MTERFLELLIAATERIPAHYFQLPMARRANGPEVKYRERVYCYELYHQLRVLLDRDERFAWYVLSGEVDKIGHAIIRRSMPDFVFHVPGEMKNLVVVEVKPVNGAEKGIQKDRRTLKYFLTERVHYQRAVELVYGNDEEAFAALRETFCGFAAVQFTLLWRRYQDRPAERIQCMRAS